MVVRQALLFTMRVLLIALLAAISYAQTDRRVLQATQKAQKEVAATDDGGEAVLKESRQTKTAQETLVKTQDEGKKILAEVGELKQKEGVLGKALTQNGIDTERAEQAVVKALKADSEAAVEENNKKAA